MVWKHVVLPMQEKEWSEALKPDRQIRQYIPVKGGYPYLMKCHDANTINRIKVSVSHPEKHRRFFFALP